MAGYYNIPSNNRELQQRRYTMNKKEIITYQVITGNYSDCHNKEHKAVIITYQVITGNYSNFLKRLHGALIITYQVITGNYSHA